MAIKGIYRIVVLLASALVVSSCHTAIGYHGSASPPASEKQVGPPPHAPAHGYRHKHSDGVQLRYDSGLGVYVVLGYADHYYCDGMYFRLNNDSWQVSANIRSGWKPAPEKKVPPGLRKTHICKKGR